MDLNAKEKGMLERLLYDEYNRMYEMASGNWATPSPDEEAEQWYARALAHWDLLTRVREEKTVEREEPKRISAGYADTVLDPRD